MTLIILPEFIINKILLYNIHPVAEILIKKFIPVDHFDLLIINLCIINTTHYYYKFNEIQKKYLSQLLQKTQYKNRWSFCCNDRGIEILY